MIRRALLALTLLLVILPSAFALSNFSERHLKKNLTAAKTNRTELNRAIAYFEAKGDSLELDAVKYLIANMQDQGYIELALFDSNRVEVPFDFHRYANFEEAYKAMNALTKVHPGLQFYNKIEIKDLDTVTSDFLIQNVELAFKAWRTLPWAKSLKYEQFREDVLPYRGSNEPLDSWRSILFDKYRTMATQLKDSTDPVETAKRICADALSDFVYDSLYYMRPTDQSYNEMAKSKHGRCEDQSNLMLFVARANALAVLSDYVPFWANSGNNHNWNSVLNRYGKAVWLEDGRELRQAYDLTGKAAKVFRKTFSEQPQALENQLRKGETAPLWLDDTHHIDVSSEYMDIADVTLNLESVSGIKSRFAYLCVFNSGDWKAADWTRINKGQVTFHNMGKQIAYVPALYEENQLKVFGGAILLKRDGTIRVLTGDTTQTSSVSLYSTNPIPDSMKDKLTGEQTNRATLGQISSFDVGATYEMFFWDNGWHMIGTKVATEPTKPLTFSHVPNDRLYWLIKCEYIANHEERIFTIENGRQIFW